MAIIYTYPLLTSIQGNDLFLVSDTSNNNATRSITAADFGAYIQATYGPGTNMYQANGSLTGNRTITLGAFDLIFDGDGVNPPMLYLDANTENVGIGGSPSAYRLDVFGDQRITGALTLGTALSITDGGTGQTTPQLATNALTGVAAATNEYVLTKDTATGNAIWKASTGPAVNTLYSGNGVVGSGRVATITDTLSFSSGSIVRNANSIKVVEVTQESDFGPIIGGNINLVANTTYVVRGTVSCSNTLTVSGDGIAITGLNRNLDKIVYTGTSNFITITDVNFTLSDVWLSSTDSASLLVNASNVAASGFNNGRTKVLEIINCQFRNCYNLVDINGFDLVDISNTLFFYIQAPSIGLRFRDTSKLEISSCELIRWYDETTNPTPS